MAYNILFNPLFIVYAAKLHQKNIYQKFQEILLLKPNVNVKWKLNSNKNRLFNAY